MRLISSKRGFTLVELIIVIAIIAITATALIGGLSSANGTNKSAVQQKSIAATESIEKIIDNYNKGLYVVPEDIIANDKESFPDGTGINRKIYDVAWFITNSKSRYQVSGCKYVYCSDMTGFEAKAKSLTKDAIAVEIALENDKIVFKNLCYVYKKNSCYFYKFSYSLQENVLIQSKDMNGVADGNASNGYNFAEARAEINKIT